MIPILSIGPRTLLNDCNHSATAIFWSSAIVTYICSSIGLFTAVRKFPFWRYLSLTVHALDLPTGIATAFCGSNPQCGPQSHNVGTPRNAFPQDKLGLWSDPV